MARTSSIMTVAAACAGLGSAAAAQVVDERIALAGQPFPGRPGEQYDLLGTFSQSLALDPDGSVVFGARTRGLTGPSRFELLRYDGAAAAVAPLLRFGSPVPGIPGSELESAGWPVGGGRVAAVWSAVIGGSAHNALIVTEPDGSATTYATTAEPVPEQSVPWDGFAITGRGGQNVTLSSTGTAAFQGAFTASGLAERGVYTAARGGPVQRILDTTQPVPGHPAAQWITATVTDTPLDESAVGISDSGAVSFRGAYTLGGATQRALFRGTPGGVTAIADSGRGDQVPGRAPGSAYGRFLNVLNNRQGDVAFTAETAGTLERGVYISRSSGPVERLYDNNDPVPGIPQAVGQSIVQLRGLNNNGDAAVFSNFNLPGGPNGGGGLGLYLIRENGGRELAMRYDQLPGVGSAWALSLDSADLNDRGDVLFQTTLGGSAGKAIFAYLGDSRSLLPVIRTGAMLDGMLVVNFQFAGGMPQGEILGSAGSAQSGNSILWDDQRRCVLSLTLRDAGGQLLPALYTFQVPAPGSLFVVATLLGAAVGRRRRGPSMPR